MALTKEKKYYVVELMDPPPEMVVGRYVCVPNSWLVLKEGEVGEEVAAVKFPIEDGVITKRRVKSREVYSDTWMIFVANVKYGTDSYKDAKNYIKILNKILHQEQNPEAREPETSQTLIIHDTQPAESELSSLESDDDDSGNPTEVGKTIKTAQKRYFTRQSRKISTTENISQAISDMSLDTTLKETLMATNNCMDEDTIGLRNTLMNEQLYDNENTMHNLFAIAGSALQDQSVLKSLEEISVSIKESIDKNVTTDSSKIKTPVFGKDFLGLMQDLYSRFDCCQIVLHKVRNQYIENCLTTKKIIELVNTLNNLHVDSDVAAAEKVPNVVVEEKTDKDTEVMNYIESSGEEQPQTVKRQEQEAIITDTADNNTKTDDQIVVNKIRGRAPKFAGPKFTLPPEYDPEDSKWTLRYRKWQKGLVELIPNSGIYVNAIKIANCKRLSKDSKTLARYTMLEVYSDNALKTCSLTGKRANAFYSADSGMVRPGLDQYAKMIMMNFVDEHAKENNWVPSSSQAVSDSLRNKLQELRTKSSVRKNK